MRTSLPLVVLFVSICQTGGSRESPRETSKPFQPSPAHNNASVYKDARPILPLAAIELEELELDEICPCMIDALIGGSCDNSLCAVSSSFNRSCTTSDTASDCNSDISRCADEDDECPSFSCSGATGEVPALIFALCHGKQTACSSGCMPLDSVCCGGSEYCDAGYHCPNSTSDGQCVLDRNSDYWLPTRTVTVSFVNTESGKGEPTGSSSSATGTASSNQTKTRTFPPPTGVPVNLNQGPATLARRRGWGRWAEMGGWLGLSVVVMAWF